MDWNIADYSPEADELDFVYIDIYRNEGSDLHTGELHAKFTEQPPSETFYIRSNTDILVEPSIITVDNTEEGKKISRELNIKLPKDRNTSSRELQFVDACESIDLKIDLPRSSVVGLCKKLLRDSTDSEKEIIDEVSNIVEAKSGRNSCHEFVNTATNILSIDQYIRIVDVLAGESELYREDYNQNRHDFVRDILLREGIGRQVGVLDQEDYLALFNGFEHAENISSPDLKQIFRSVVEDHSIRMENVADNIDLLSIDEDDRPDCLLPKFYAEMIIDGEYHTAKKIIHDWVGQMTDDLETYEKMKKLASEKDKYDERASAWFEVLRSALHKSDNEFHYVSANYCHWLAKYYEIANKPEHIVRDLFHAASIQYEEVDMGSFVQTTTHKKNIHRGKILHYRNEFEAASDCFTESIKLAAQVQQEYDRDWPKITNPFSELAKTKIKEREERNDYDSVIQLLNEAIRILKSHPEGDTDYYETFFEAKLHEAKSNKLVNQQQFEAAKKAVGKAIQSYKQCGREGLAEGVIVRQYEIEALIAHSQGEFDRAANQHDKITGYFEPTNGFGRFHTIQNYLSRAKAALIENDVENAMDWLDKIEDEFGYLKNEGKNLKLLIEVYRDFLNDQPTSVPAIFDQLDLELTGSEKSEHLIDYSDDYTHAITMILAAQHLQKYQVNRDLVDLLVQISIEGALIQSKADELGQHANLDSINVSETWKRHLPRELRNDIQEIQMQKEANTGNLSGAAMTLCGLLEKQLEAVAEYYGRQKWKDSWRQHISETHPEALSFGELVNFFSTEGASAIPGQALLKRKFDEPVIDGNAIVPLRNELAHSKISKLNQDQFDTVEKHVDDILESLSNGIPVIGSVESQTNFDVYSVELHWSKIQQKVWIQTGADLESGKVYYFPVDHLGSTTTQEVPEDKIIECKSDRVRSNLI